MLNPKNDRLDYGEQLIPPEGYELNYAVGTTYSLDLEALMIIPVALFYSQSLDIESSGIRFDILDGLTKASDKISIFCQKGKIKVPKDYHYLMAYWEKGIEEIAMKNEFSSFHPKVWIIRFTKEKELSIFRLLITSRNLTFARDWDVAFSTDGKTGQIPDDINLPLVHFASYLESKSKRKFPKGFIQELSRVSFELPIPFKSMEFFPIGIPSQSKTLIYNNPLQEMSWDNLLIISPFVDEKTLQHLKSKIRKNKWVFSRKSELDSLPDKILSYYSCMQFSQFILSAELLEALSEDNNLVPQNQDLHAKLFIGQFEDKIKWLLGSANCSTPALEARNIEFLVGLSGISNELKPFKIASSLTEVKKDEIALFESYDSTNKNNDGEQKQLDRSLRKIVYDLSIIRIHGQSLLIEGGTAYNLIIDVDLTKLRIPDEFSLRIKPLPEKERQSKEVIPGSMNHIDHFTGYSEIQLSPFIVWEIWEDKIRHIEFVVRMEIELPESRMRRIFTSIINSREKFLKYLTFLLLGDEAEIIENSSVHSIKDQVTNKKTDNLSLQGIPVFEKLLIAASRYPKKLDSIDKLVEYLKSETAETGEQIITEDFENIWNVFRLYRENAK